MYIQANKIHKNFSGTPLFEALDFVIDPQEKIGLIGQNGTGKTTLLQILLRKEGIDQGTVSYKKGLRIGWVPQKLLFSEYTSFEYIYQSFEELENIRQQLHRYEQKMADLEEELERNLFLYGNLQQQFEEKGGYQLEDRIRTVMKGLGLGQQEQTSLYDLSGGERVRVELARVLVEDNDVLLLDEPTNHLDLKGIQWLENFLKTTKKAFVVISHDRTFLDQVTQRTVEIEDGKIINYAGNYTYYLKQKKVRIAELSKNYELQQKEIHRLRAMIRRYRQWGNEGDNEAFFKKAKEIERRIEKMTVIKAPIEPKKRLQKIQQAQRSGKEVILADQIGKIQGDKLLFTDSSFAIYRGERVAILGENGSGKSTLLKLILGELSLDEGKIRLGASIKMGYLPQQLVFEQPTQRLIEYTREILPEEQKARQTLAQFGFYSEDVAKRIQDLSGGEQVRLYLLKLLQEKINLLILDEPTNHVDIYVREEIEDLLEKFTGTLLTVTHDRYFLEKHFQQQLVIEHQMIHKK
ncbi:ribosomal protection-like ABC-F family protein [Enterococcus olivae]